MRISVHSSFTSVSTQAHHCRQPRLALPLLRTADLLITHCFVDPAEELGDDTLAPGASWASSKAAEEQLLALVRAIRDEARGCADPTRLMVAATALCHAAGRGSVVRAAAFPAVLALLASRYPKVRFRPCHRLMSPSKIDARCACS